MQSAITGLLGIAEAYPELRAVESFKALQAELSDTENKIAAARRYYNNTVRRYNTVLQSVPTNVIGGATGFTRARVLPDRGRRRPRAGRRHARPVTLQEQIRVEPAADGLVLLGFAALSAALVAASRASYEPGVGGVLGIAAIVYGVFAWFFADKIVAAAARRAPGHEGPGSPSCTARSRTPRSAPADEDAGRLHDPGRRPNAFAAGRNPEHAYVAATTGLVAKLSTRELEGVMAHEIAHIRNRDVRLMSLAAVLVGVIALVADMLMRITMFGGGRNRERTSARSTLIVGIAAMMLAPIGAALLQMTLSRRREYLADATAAEITGDGEGLALALAKLRDDPTPLQKVTRATAHLYIESPLRDHKGLRSSLGGMFDTHPPLEERIHRLAEAGGFPEP